MAGSGEAADYYNDPEAQKENQTYGYGNGNGNRQWNGPQHMPPPPTYSQNFGQWESKPSYDQAFKVEKPKWNDLIPGLLFLAVCAGFVAVSGISLQGYAATYGFNGDGIYGTNNDFGLSTNTIVLFIFCLVVALVLGYGYIWLARMFTKQFIWITGILNVVFSFVTAIYFLVKHYWSGGIVFLLFACFAAFCFWTWIPRIPFSVLMLQTAIDVSKTYGHVYLVSFLGGLIALAFGAYFSVSMVAVYVKFEPGANPACSAGGNCSSAVVIGLLVFLTFAAYWISEWLKNTIYTICSGVYGAWFFAPNNPPKGSTRGATRRAMTYSFGSISFGSLLVAIINMLRQICSIAQQEEAGAGNMAASCAFCILQCFLGILDWAITFINRYAFSYIALYGKSYIQSAKATWRLIKDRGIEGLIQQCLIGPVFTMGATFVAYACALMGYVYLVYTDPAYNSNGEFTPVVIAFAFLIGLQVTNCFTTPLSAGIDTIFVAMAWDPEALMREHGELYAKMTAVYPQVAQSIRP